MLQHFKKLTPTLNYELHQSARKTRVLFKFFFDIIRRVNEGFLKFFFAILFPNKHSRRLLFSKPINICEYVNIHNAVFTLVFQCFLAYIDFVIAQIKLAWFFLAIHPGGELRTKGFCFVALMCILCGQMFLQ